MANPGHTHLFRVPEPLEKFLSQLGDLEKMVGAEPVARVRSMIEQALAAEARGDQTTAVAGIARAMEALASLAAGIDPAEAKEMGAVAAQFGRALLRGDAGEAREAAEAMRARAGAKVLKRE